MIPSRNCSSGTTTRWQCRVDHHKAEVWGWVATRLIISTWWGGSSGERQMQSARWIFKRDKGNGAGSSKFNTRRRVKKKQTQKQTETNLLWSAAATPWMNRVLMLHVMNVVYQSNARSHLVVNSFTDTWFSTMSEISLPVSRKRIWTCLHQRAQNPCRVFMSMKNTSYTLCRYRNATWINNAV